jgi:hypothetical protein
MKRRLALIIRFAGVLADEHLISVPDVVCATPERGVDGAGR